MTYREILERLLKHLAEIEALKGKSLSPQQLGELLKELGEALVCGEYPKDTDTLGNHWGSCTHPTITSTGNISAHIDSTMCICGCD